MGEIKPKEEKMLLDNTEKIPMKPKGSGNALSRGEAIGKRGKKGRKDNDHVCKDKIERKNKILKGWINTLKRRRKYKKRKKKSVIKDIIID